MSKVCKDMTLGKVLRVKIGIEHENLEKNEF